MSVWVEIMRRTDFQINFIWPLLVFVGTFIASDYSLNYACQITVIYLIFAAIIRLGQMAYILFLEIHKHHWKLPPHRKKGLFSFITILCIILISVGIFVSDKTRALSTQYTVYKMERVMKKVPSKIIEAAMLQLKNHPNDMRYCSPLFFPSLKKNDANAIATYLAYYALSEKYCTGFWDWGRENCAYLREFNYGSNALEAKQNIRLCEFAKKSELVQKIKLVGEANGQTK